MAAWIVVAIVQTAILQIGATAKCQTSLWVRKLRGMSGWLRCGAARHFTRPTAELAFQLQNLVSKLTLELSTMMLCTALLDELDLIGAT